MERQPETTSDGFLWQAFLILAASAFTPLQVWVNNPESPAFATTALVISVLTALGLGVRAVFVRVGADPQGITSSIAIFVVFAMNTGEMIDSVVGGRWTILGLALLVSGIPYRLRLMGLLRGLVAWGAFLLLAIPSVNYITTIVSNEVTVEANPELSLPSLESRHDVVVIVLDGYASGEVLREFHDFDNPEFYAGLEGIGLSVGRNVKSNFPLTALSVVNTLSLDYVVNEQHLSRADFDVLYEMLGGNNNLARVLTESGYTQTYVESGWLGTRCRSLVDVCVAGPWPDETVYDIALRSLVRGLPGLEEGRSYSRGALRNIRWLENDLHQYLTNEVSDYVYVHVLAPHPPFFLTSSCESIPTPELSGFTGGGSWFSPDQIEMRSEGYQEQVRCLNSVLTTVARAAVQEDAIVVMFGDHGSDFGGQLYLDGSEWTDAQIRERFGVFFAGYGPGCDFEDVGSLVNVSRRILGCLSGTDLVDLPLRAFLTSKSWDLTEIDLALAFEG
ncbi:MAG TPA: hypothetical protein VJA46_00115 [Acidimicrobiia bacterium]|nr:hypothetical protein [Acidimicrobiia bacterium]